jgi:hypothetical protein
LHLDRAEPPEDLIRSAGFGGRGRIDIASASIPTPDLTTNPTRAIGAYPIGAVGLSVVGAIFLELEGIYVSLLGGSFSLTNDLVPSGPLVPSPAVLGVLALVEAAVALALAVLVYTSPGTHTFAGIASLTVALLSLYSGGGFLIGAFLVYVGGVIAVYHGTGRRRRPPVPAELEESDEDPVVEADLLDSAAREPDLEDEL